MSVRKIKDKVYAIGTIDWDRQTFDELTPLHEGTTYNSYIIFGSDKTALIDTVEPKTFNSYLNNLNKLGVKKIDYLISNHAEQDHSGSIPEILKLYPEAKVITNEKCKGFLKDLLLIDDEKFMVINDGDKISLGDKTLEFTLFPWVHWPETMFTFLREDRILFSGDLFGSHLAISELEEKDKALLERSAKVYFAEIMYPFRSNIRSNFEKVKKINPSVIAPTHGPLHYDIEFILKLYEEWISDKVSNKVLIPYVSMHGSTLAMMEYIVNKLIEKGIEVRPFNLTTLDIGNYAIELMDAATILLGTSTVLGNMHPMAAYALFFTNLLRPNVKNISFFGSYGWGGKTAETIKSFITNIKADLIEPVLIKGYPKDSDFKLLDRLVDDIYNNHKKIGII